jgi:hypothetical protein
MTETAQDQTITVPFTQILMPNGTRDRVEVDLPDPDGTLAVAVAKIQGLGLAFECEMLRDHATVSFTITVPDEADIRCEVCSNGPDVPGVVAKLIREGGAAVDDGSLQRSIDAVTGGDDDEDDDEQTIPFDFGDDLPDGRDDPVDGDDEW